MNENCKILLIGILIAIISPYLYGYEQCEVLSGESGFCYSNCHLEECYFGCMQAFEEEYWLCQEKNEQAEMYGVLTGIIFVFIMKANLKNTKEENKDGPSN